MDQVLTFDKSLQQRLQEYNDVLAGYDCLPVSQIQREWGFYLELTLDPSGWQAIWKIPRRSCQTLHISFPSIVLVYVVSVDLRELTALVKILAVQDDIHIPAKHTVPLIQLWPTRSQDDSVALNLSSTANVMDMLRFFYNNLFMPWDYEDNDSIDWKGEHLEARLRLYYDMKNGVIPRFTSEHINSLTSEAKRLHAKREQLEAELEDEKQSDDEVEAGDNAKVESLMELHIRMMEIKREVDVLENPLLRNVIIKKHQEMTLNNEEASQKIWLIYHQATAAEYISFLTKVKSLFPNEPLEFASMLSTILESANSGDIFILSPGKHTMKSTGALEFGGMLRGIENDREKTVISTSEEDVMWDFKGDTIVIENLTINAYLPQCAMIVRRGTVTIKNCILRGDRCSSTHQGIILLDGAKLELVDCEITGFYTAIIGNSGSKLTMKNVEISDCDFGIKVYDNCTVNAIKTVVRNCTEYGICVETENTLDGVDEPRIGDFDTLNIIPKFQMEFMKGDNNEKGDAIINQKSKLTALHDLFSNPDLDPSICIESDEEMDVLEQTVLERRPISPVTI